MSNKNQLNEEELENVTGGSYGQDGIDTKGQFTGFVDMYSLHDPKYVDQELYFTTPNYGYTSWFRARIVKSYEKPAGCEATTCSHEVVITCKGSMKATRFDEGNNTTIDGKSYAAYTTKNF